uniref:chitin synthase n=1 Tax=Mastacembelus armatus TaxID=205130 RepID=A0A3Q3MRH9_9TELE
VSFLLLITLSNEGTKTIPAEQKPVALLCVGCCLVASSVLLLQKSIWKACYKSSKVPAKKTFMASLGAAILTIVAMPHLDIVTNVMILNSVAVVSALLQVSTQCTARERNRFLLPSITSMVLIILGFVLFCFLYIMKDPANTKMIIWVGLAVGGAFLVSFNWWETYFRLIGENSSSIFLKNLCKDMTKCQNVLHILSSLLRIAVTACVLGAYVPLAKMDWDIVKSIPSRETRIIVITVGVQLMSSALCHWFALAACKMHALRRCFILPLYLASLAVMALLIIPVIVYYQDYRVKLNGTASINFTGYCNVAVDGRTLNQNSSVFPELVLDVTHTLCFLDMSKVTDIGILTGNKLELQFMEYIFTRRHFQHMYFILSNLFKSIYKENFLAGSAASWWLGLVFATFHLWYLSIYRIQRTQDLFIRRFYEGGFLEQSLLLNTRFDIQTTRKWKQTKTQQINLVFLCATMWHETYDEMMKIIISIFRLDRYRPRKKAETSDMTFEGHVYFDDAFRDVPGSRGRHVNEYAEMLVEIIKEVYSNQQQIPDQRIVRTPYGGRVVVTMPYGNSLVVHFKDRKLIRHKKRWSQVMYLYYLLGWKVATKYYKRWESGEDEAKLTGELQKEKHNTYLLALDGDTDFHPAAVMLLIDRLQLYPRVGAACGRIHPTGSGPMVWYQKFEYAVGHWLHKTAEHVFGCVLCSPGCFSLFRADALMDDNVMKKYTIKASEARHYIQYDQGEDRWLCTLLLKQGWRVEYVAASDAYTNAPEEFKEFYNQRRRWGPSTMANIVDLLGSSNLIINKNPSMSTPYMLYQLFCLTSSILAPSTVVLMIAGQVFVFQNKVGSIQLPNQVLRCFKVKADTQILIAAVMSVLYAFIMMIAALIIIGNMIKDKTILTPSSIFIIFLAGFYLLTAVMHPQEISLVVHGWLYMLSIPSAYLLLAIYSMVNMNNVSWGTRETTPAAGPAKPVAAAPQTQPFIFTVKNTFKRLLTRIQCCKETYRTGSEASVSQQNLTDEPEESVPQPQNTIVEDESRPEEEESMTLYGFCVSLQDEELFFRELTAKYLEPLPEDKNKQKKVTENLKELRNKITFVYFLCNAFWLVATFCLQLIGGSVFIQVPKLDMHLQLTGEYIYIDPLGFMFILAFATLIIVQFFAMLYHRYPGSSRSSFSVAVFVSILNLILFFSVFPEYTP